jgi:hypothetical protein
VSLPGTESGASVHELVVAADPNPWTVAGFRVEGDMARVGATRLRLAGERAGRGIVDWSLRGLPDGRTGVPPDLDGLPTRTTRDAPVEPDRHPNGVVRIDHVVAFSPNLDRTIAALEHAGLDLRRVRDATLPGGGTRQAFFRLGEVIFEVIQQPAPDGGAVDPSKPARLWGLAFMTNDLDATVAAAGDAFGPPREAIQPGRRIATARREAGLGSVVAFITPPPGR